MALAMALAVAAAVLVWARAEGPLSQVETPREVVVVFAGPDETGMQVAQAIEILDVRKRTVRYVDPLATVTVPGTSYRTLRDAYPFGGAETAAETLVEGDRVGWLDVPYGTWMSAVGSSGISIDVSSRMDVFDGERLVTFSEGSQTISAQDMASLANGAAFLRPRERSRLMGEVGAECVALLADVRPAGLQTNMSKEAVRRVLALLGEWE